MKLKGVNYDVGHFMAFNWRPKFDLRVVRRELEIIKNDLHCTAVRIGGESLGRLMPAAEAALGLGLEVWLSPALWEKRPGLTLAYIAQAATEAEKLRQRWPEQLVLVLGSELTLFMQGIVEGNNITARMRNPNFIARVKAGEHNKPLNEFLAKANAAARAAFKGKVTYASLVWEAVDWSLFDFVGVDHYRSARIEDKYAEMLKPCLAHGKPAVITEFGYATCREGIGGSAGFSGSSGLGGSSIIDVKSQFFHFAIPVVGRFLRPCVRGNHVRDEGWQARKIIEQLEILDQARVEGAFISQFVSQITPYSDDPRYDLDMASASLVKYFEGRRRGKTYPDMPWEPKEAFHAVAEYYSRR